MIATDTSQSERLISCGVSPDTADMSICTIIEPALCEYVAWNTPMLLTIPYNDAKVICRGDDVKPAWSLSALISLIPSVISGKDRLHDYYFLLRLFSDRCEVSYEQLYSGSTPAIIAERALDPIDACVRLIEKLIANNYDLSDKTK